MATSIRLEFDQLQILKKREKWEIYFMLVTANPTNSAESVYTTMPSKDPIKMTKMTDNLLRFKPEGVGTEGLFVLELAMPESNSINVDVYLMQSRQKMRNTGGKLDEVMQSTGSGGSLAGKVVNTLGKANPWVVIGSTAGKEIGSIMSGMKDRQLGFMSLSEDFSNAQAGDNVRKNNFSTGFAALQWNWVVK